MDAGVAPTDIFIPLPGYREITRRQQMGNPVPRGRGITVATVGRWAVDRGRTPSLILP